MPKSISFRRLPGGNALFFDYIDDFERTRDFFHFDYRQPLSEWKPLAEARTHSFCDRGPLIAALLRDAERWGGSAQTLRNIEALRDPQTLAVVTGQQVGLFGGPLFTFYKAIATILWARAIQKSTGRRTVPVFWMETSDHDFFEVNHIRLLNLEGEEVLLSLTNPPEEKRRVVGSIVLNGEVEQLVQRLWTLLPPSSYRGQKLELLSTCYHPGETLGGAFAKLYSYLFKEDGLILYDAENKPSKKSLTPLLDHIISSGKDLNRLLHEATHAVNRAGYSPQIQPQEDRLQLFARIGDVRVPISSSGTLLHDGDPPEQLGIDNLRRKAAEHPEFFLPKVSLRPIFQDYLFPTVAYIAGPTEIAYFAQLKPLYDRLEVTMPAIIPRLSATLIEGKVKKVLEKYQFTPEQLRSGTSKLINQILESDSTYDLVGLFARAREKWSEIRDNLLVGMMAIDPTLDHPVEKTLERWLMSLDVLEEKARAAMRRKNEMLVSQINKACMNLMPGGQLQERRFSLPYYMVRYGSALWQKIKSQVKLDLYRHQLIYLEDES